MFKLPDLPFAYDALQPAMSERTLRLHHDKHQATYVKTVNELLEKDGRTARSLEDVIQDAAAAGEQKLFNNAAQAWNHAFFWAAMTPKFEPPRGELAEAIDKAFGSLDSLKEAFVAKGAGHFGSGWVWLTAERQGDLKVIATHDADDTLTRKGMIPLIVCDIWEHAYYLDYQNDRKGFLEVWFDRLPHWAFAAYQLTAALGRGDPWRYPAADAAKDRQSA
jgi:Fe-Mn family superoxide dismutase